MNKKLIDELLQVRDYLDSKIDKINEEIRNNQLNGTNFVGNFIEYEHEYMFVTKQSNVDFYLELKGIALNFIFDNNSHESVSENDITAPFEVIVRENAAWAIVPEDIDKISVIPEQDFFVILDDACERLKMEIKKVTHGYLDEEEQSKIAYDYLKKLPDDKKAKVIIDSLRDFKDYGYNLVQLLFKSDLGELDRLSIMNRLFGKELAKEINRLHNARCADDDFYEKIKINNSKFS